MKSRDRIRATLALRLWSFRKIRLVSRVEPSVVELTEDRCEIALPLNWRTRSHLRSIEPVARFTLNLSVKRR